jgi:outer membrane protein OmpA-like peptidoglycan-associated protein
LVEDNVENNLCYGAEEGLVDITVSGGVTPYEFTWSNGEKSEDLINVISDTYSVSVKDANGSVQTLQTEVTQPEPLVLEVDSVNNVNCAGDETGYLSVVASGGVAPYSYSWNNGNRDQNLEGAKAGVYLATVTDANGCETTIEAEITEPPTMIATIDAITDIQCYGDSTGAIYVTAQEGVEPYTFEWSNGATTPDITGLKAGSYRLKITQGNGCVTYLDAEVVEPSPFNASVASVTDVNCYGDLDGAIDIDVSGGVEPYNYSWSNGAETQDIASVRADDYSVLITDANGCLITKNTTIEQPPKLRVVIDSVRNVKCCGDTSGAIFISVEGGEGPYEYEWSNGATTQDIENLELGKYTVTVTDARGCTVDALDEQDVDLYEEVVTTGKFTTRDIQFDVAKSTIRPESFRVVNKIATLMKEHPDLAFRIDGHTDADGSAESNLQLSQDRAESIKAALIKFGIAETRLKTKGWGESRPIASNATQEGKQQNRRVEFISLTGTLSGDLVENPDFSLDEEEERED